MFTPGPFELAIIGGIALLLFGKRLPEVARGLGQSLTEFKKGVKGIEDDVRSVGHAPASEPPRRVDPVDEARTTDAPKFEPVLSSDGEEETHSPS